MHRHPWPGNVRQLKNVIESAIILSDTDVLGPAELRLGQFSTPASRQSEDSSWQPISLKQLEAHHIEKILDHVNWNKKKAAELLGIERSTLYARIRNLNLEPPGVDR